MSPWQVTEVIVGLSSGLDFGPVVVFVSGGIQVEPLNDIVLCLLLLSVGIARAMVSENLEAALLCESLIVRVPT